VQSRDGAGERFRILRLGQQPLRDHLRRRPGPCRHDWFPGRHGLQEHDPEPLLDAGQGEHIAALVLPRQNVRRDVAQPAHRLLEPLLPPDAPQAPGFRPPAHDPHLQLGNAPAQPLGRFEQQFQPLARIEPADAQHRELAGIGRRRVLREALPPPLQVDCLGHDPRLFREPVQLLQAPGGVVAGGHHQAGPPHVPPLAGCLDAHARPGSPALEPHFVGNHALDRSDMQTAGSARQAVTVHVETHHNVEAAEIPPAQAFVKPQPFERVYRPAQARRDELHLAAQGLERPGQGRNPVERAAASHHVQRRRSDERQSQGHPSPLWTSRQAAPAIIEG
jgi:hypothetical protein